VFQVISTLACPSLRALIGNLNLLIFKAEFRELQTSEVVLTDERKIHIKNNHPNDYIFFDEYAAGIVTNPDLIICDNKNIGTVFMIKRLPDTNINAVIRLALESDVQGLKNSIMTFFRVRESNVRKLIAKNKIIYSRE